MRLNRTSLANKLSRIPAFQGKLKLPPFSLLATFIVLVFLTGGGSRSDISSLIILRPISIIFCGIAIYSLSREVVAQNKTILCIAVMIFFLPLLQLIPMPPQFWHMLPAREIVVKIDKLVGLESQWRPISITPSETWNSVYSLFVPLTVLLFGIQLDQEQKKSLLPLILGLGIFSGLWGILQISGDPNGPAYLYRITNNGSSVGLFANRNHAAVFLTILIPMLAVFVSVQTKKSANRRARIVAAIAAGAIVIPLILVTGSRAGLILGVVGLISAPLVFRKPKYANTQKARTHRLSKWQASGVAILGMGLVAATIAMSRAPALSRLMEDKGLEGMRLSTADIVFELAWSVFPLGSGYGSFVDMYKVVEPDDLLGPTYFNHAHNDWLELFLTGGAPAVLLLMVVLAACFRQAYYIFRQSIFSNDAIIYGRLGFIILCVLGLASVVDYPLRVPSLMCVWVVASIWLNDSYQGSLKNAGD